MLTAFLAPIVLSELCSTEERIEFKVSNQMHKNIPQQARLYIAQMLNTYSITLIEHICYCSKITFKNSLRIHEENTKKNHKRVVSLCYM